jgi:hypothetical protein
MTAAPGRSGPPRRQFHGDPDPIIGSEMAGPTSGNPMNTCT